MCDQNSHLRVNSNMDSLTAERLDDDQNRSSGVDEITTMENCHQKKSKENVHGRAELL